MDIYHVDIKDGTFVPNFGMSVRELEMIRRITDAGHHKLVDCHMMVMNPHRYIKRIAEAGADIIIGTHPHVEEPVEWITAENGNESLCYYSLGNYVSTQKNALSMLEGMAWLTFHVAEDGVSIERKTTGVIPLVCQYTSGPVRFENVYLLEEYTEELAASHGIRNYAGVVLHLEDLQKWSDEILGDFVLTKDQALHNFKTDSINQ